ncbi:MAG: LacI family transcriptional regulator [Erysipelotrichaceae bacterium]|jgi:LacI family transcriptional regulator|nr:LacI family transcriptional regulator [Erysipelotrichaceae bacterium]
MKRVTIYDVANEANVSLATVSRVINGLEIVREDTRIRVNQAIEKLGYKPNAIAQGLALQKTTSIALLIPEASFSYTGQIINGLLDVAKIYKYNITLHTTSEAIMQIGDIIENIIKSRVDGVIIYNDKLMVDELTALTKYQFPIVLVGNQMSSANIASVYVNLQKAMYELVSSYLEQGKTDIAIVQDRKNKYMVEQLILGASQAFEKKGLVFKNFIEIPREYRSSYTYLKEYFKTHKHELVIAHRDSQAMAVINAAAENDIKIPNEMEVVCVMDTKYNSMIRPQISSFAIPSYDLGAVAMRVMTKMLNQNPVEEREIELSYLFTPRQSTK